MSGPGGEDPFRDWAQREALPDEAGRTVLVVTTAEESSAGGRSWADGAWRPPAVPPADAATVALDRLGGWLLSTDDDALAEELRARGAEEVRRVHVYTLELTGMPVPAQVPDGVRLRTLTGDMLAERAKEVAALALRAYPPEHPDRTWAELDGAVEGLRRAARGEVLGPVLDVSVLALRDDDVVGVCLVVDRDGAPPFGGPWVLEIFRSPDAASGIGAAMLSHAARAAREIGLLALSLAVTHTNDRARSVYERLGFVDVAESRTLQLSGRP